MKLLLLLSFLCLYTIGQAYEKPFTATPTLSQEGVKTAAFAVLTTKCNPCHATKKKQDIFTLDNVDSLASEIYKQVFVKKKMPKGRKNKLSEQESNALKKWLDLVLKE